ncbi:hypothetical protein PV325_001604 [Microctonus aethiopoides]|uniref:Cytochrome b5 n=1 Tax=Microctonus aethiopoides TaxID=144406 RepID=A0AA39F9F6_9HYME|nr:hypothetical protein PV325_001604 [Microctonus aethiopoides]KAK0165410.1 hypothetical protein PV328_003924 [Microctonus aethiopoides]
MSKILYSLEEIKLYNGVNQAKTWIIIGESIYDVTDYMNKHPGGRELIMEYAGNDATVAFNNFGHSFNAKNIMKLYKIGKVLKERNLMNDKNNIKDNITKRRYLSLLFSWFCKCDC